MMRLRHFAALSVAAISFTTLDAIAAIDPAAPVVLLRTSCNDGAGSTLNNCFTDPIALNDWMWLTRKPTDAAPLSVEIGPGRYGQFACGDAVSKIAGNVSFRGAGMDQTTLASITLTAQCAKATFQDMTVGGTGINYAVVVLNAGTKTTWTNVRLVGTPGIWQEYCAGTPASALGQHYFFGSKLEGRIGGYYQVKCDESWFYGSEITTKDSLTNELTLFQVQGKELHVYGSVVRVLETGTYPVSGSRTLKAFAATGGSVHIHGTGIDIISTGTSPALITALDASNGATIHANASAFNLSTAAGGSVTRINTNNGSGHIHAPYLWEHIPNAVTMPGFTSQDGADMTTVIASDGKPHMVVYSATCPANARWYDQVDKVCRSQ